MITKEQAREIYNHYAQIETTNNAISTLRKVKKIAAAKDLKEGVIKDKYSFGGSIKLEIPEWMLRETKSLFNGCSVYNISTEDAILVLENHVVRLQKELEELNKQAMEE